MSQQDIEFNTVHREQPDPPYGSYGAVPPLQQPQQQYSIGIGGYGQPAGQKLTGADHHPLDMHPTAGQRLALGIVSIIAFVIAFMISLAAAAALDHSNNGFAEFILFMGLVFSFVVVIVINALYNRRH